MVCSLCGERCQGEYCAQCSQIKQNEARYGDSVDRDDDGDEWAVEQTALDGGRMAGQTTLDGGVATDGGDGDA